jgi:P27 family predicted phage terminase small subunit
MRGRKPKPIQQHLNEGDPSHLGVKKLEQRLESLPRAARGLPDPPAHLPRLAREQWLIWREDLEIMEQDYRADAVTLEGACVSYARAVEADRVIERNGPECEEKILDNVTGEVLGVRIKNHPAVARQNMYWRNVHMFCSSMGLTLAARQPLTIEPVDSAQQDLMAILGRPREMKVPTPVQ